MADLLTTFANAYRYNPNAAFEGAQNMQNLMTGALNFQQKREALEAQRSLKELYANNPQPSFEDLARINPEFAMQQQLSNVDLQGKMLGMQKTQGEISEQQKTAFARTVAPIAEEFASKQMNPEVMAQFHGKIGNALAQFEQQTGIKPPPGFNVEQLSPESILMWAMPYYKSPTMDNIAKMKGEQMMSGVPQRPSYSDVAGRTEYGPAGTRYIQPAPRPNLGVPTNQGVTGFAPPNVQQQPNSPDIYAQSGQQNAPYKFTTSKGTALAAYDLKSARDAALTQLTGDEQKEALDWIDREMRTAPQGAQQATPSAAPSGFVTPADEMRMRAEEERMKSDLRTQERKAEIEAQTAAAGERKTAELGAESSESRKKAMDAFALIPPLPEVEKLILASTSGADQVRAAEFFKDRTGKSTPGMQAIGRLEPIAGRLLDAVNRAPGAQSDKDQIIQSLKTGNIADPNVAAEKRLESYKEFVSQMRKMIAKETGIDAETTIEPPKAGALRRATNEEEAQRIFDSLTPGEKFIGPEGMIHTKPIKRRR